MMDRRGIAVFVLMSALVFGATGRASSATEESDTTSTPSNSSTDAEASSERAATGGSKQAPPIGKELDASTDGAASGGPKQTPAADTGPPAHKEPSVDKGGADFVQASLIGSLIVLALVLLWRGLVSPSLSADKLNEFTTKIAELERRLAPPPPHLDEVTVENAPGGLSELSVRGVGFGANTIATVDGASAEVLEAFHDRLVLRARQPSQPHAFAARLAVHTDSGSAMRLIDFPASPLGITEAMPAAAGGWTRVTGTGFSPGIVAKVGGGEPECAFIEQNALLVNWPAGKAGDPTTLQLDRDGVSKSFDTKYS